MSLRLRYTISVADHGSSLLNFLKRQGISRKTITATKHRGGLMYVNGMSQRVNYVLTTGDKVEIVFPEESRSDGLSPFIFKLDIVYEDEYLLILNKPAGLPTIPCLRYPNETLANALIHYYDQCQINSTIHFVNRLDRDTSGLLMVAKYRHIHHLLTRDIKQIERKYYALVKGDPGSGTVEAPISREKEGSVRRCVREGGQRAVTHYRSVACWADMNLVECQLETGRTHQIRVHLAHLGHPLVGDTLYDETQESGEGQLLHSYQLSFTHPLTHEYHEFQTDLPQRFIEQKK